MKAALLPRTQPAALAMLVLGLACCLVFLDNKSLDDDLVSKLRVLELALMTYVFSRIPCLSIGLSPMNSCGW